MNSAVCIFSCESCVGLVIGFSVTGFLQIAVVMTWFAFFILSVQTSVASDFILLLSFREGWKISDCFCYVELNS